MNPSPRSRAFSRTILPRWVLRSTLPALVPGLLGLPGVARGGIEDERLLAGLVEGEGLMRQGAFEQAVTHLEAALAAAPLAAAPNRARVHLQRGIALVLLDRPAQARAAFQEALCLDPRVSPAAIDPSPATARVFTDAQASLHCPEAPPIPGPAAPPPPAAEGSVQGTVGTVLLVVGAVSLAGGAGLGIAALDAEEDSTKPGQSPDEAQDAASRADDLALGADICFVAGGAAAITGLILLLTRDTPPPASGARLLPLGPDGTPGLLFALNF